MAVPRCQERASEARPHRQISVARAEVAWSPMNVGDLVRIMESIAPARFAAVWDNVGLLVGDESSPLAHVLLAIDCTAEVLEEARREGASAIVSYHPPIFAPQRRFLAGSIAHDAARAGIAIHSPHTAYDVADGGTNDVLADALPMTARAPLKVSPPLGATGTPLGTGEKVGTSDGTARKVGMAEKLGTDGKVGMGRVGPVDTVSVTTLVDRIKHALSVERVLVAGPVDRAVSRAAVCAGSGGELLTEAIEAGADLFLTGELRHHDALRGMAAGLTLVCTLHSASERAALAGLERRLTAALPGVSIARSRVDREPFVFV